MGEYQVIPRAAGTRTGENCGKDQQTNSVPDADVKFAIGSTRQVRNRILVFCEITEHKEELHSHQNFFSKNHLPSVS